MATVWSSRVFHLPVSTGVCDAGGEVTVRLEVAVVVTVFIVLVAEGTKVALLVAEETAAVELTGGPHITELAALEVVLIGLVVEVGIVELAKELDLVGLAAVEPDLIVLATEDDFSELAADVDLIELVEEPALAELPDEPDLDELAVAEEPGLIEPALAVAVLAVLVVEVGLASPVVVLAERLLVVLSVTSVLGFMEALLLSG